MQLLHGRQLPAASALVIVVAALLAVNCVEAAWYSHNLVIDQQNIISFNKVVM